MHSVFRRGLLFVSVGMWFVAQAASQEAPPAGPGVDRHPVDEAAAVAREMDGELVRLEAALDRIGGLRSELERHKAERDRAAESDEERAAELTVTLRSAVEAGHPSDGIYDAVVAEFGGALQRLREALDALDAPSALIPYEARLNFETVDVAKYRQRTDLIREQLAGVAEAESQFRTLERQTRWADVEAQGRLVHRLNELRIECLASMSSGRRSKVLGVSRDGFGQLLREVDHVTLSARLYGRTRAHQLRQARSLAGDLFVIGSLSYAALRLGLVIAIALWIRARWREWVNRVRRRLFRTARGIAAKRRTDTVLALIEAVLPWTLFLLVVFAIGRALTPAVNAPELDVLYQVALIYGTYRVAIDLFVALIERIAHRYGLRMAADRRVKLLNTVRWVMRVVTPVVVLLLIASRVVGRGYIYHVVVRFSWLVVLATLIGIIFSWRRVMTEGFLAAQPTGRLSNLVRRSQGRWFGLLITPACFVAMTGRGIVALASDFALGFDQTRRALAFLLRRRIEKQAEVRGYANGDIERMPLQVVEAFTENPVSDGPLVVDYFPALDELQIALKTWTDEAVGGSVLLTGERGSGKTSWLQQVSTGDVPKTLITLDYRPSTPDALAQVLGRELLPDEGERWTVDRLGATLLDGPRRVVIIDLAQHLFLATVGGYSTFDGFAALVERTRNNVFWICGMSAFAWQRLRSVRPTPLVFRHHFALGSWSEERIRDLIRTRVEVAGIRLNYADLVVDRLEGVSAQARLIESEEGYTRLLWDYADGNPRVALHFFLRSLELEASGTFRVRLFRSPPVEVMESLNEEALFTLAATIAHENLSLEEVATVTRYPVELCRIYVDRLVEMGVLWIANDRYRISTFWHRAVVRLLRRKNLLND